MKSVFYPQNPPHFSPELVVYFSGWGMPPSAIAHLQLPENSDLLICYDYTDLQLDFDFSPYSRIRLVAFSLGVWVANQVMSKVKLRSATAMNGTLNPCDVNFGIPPEIFKGTLTGLDDINRLKFERRMCGGKSELNTYQALAEQRSLQNIRLELTALYGLINQSSPTSPIFWDYAFISSQDRIFPTANQVAYWQQHSPRTMIRVLDGSHYALPQFERWDNLWR